MAFADLNQDQLKPILELISVEVAAKLTSIIEQNVTINFAGSTDSCIQEDKFIVKKDSYLFTIPMDQPDLGPISLISNHEQVFVISDLAMRGSGKIDGSFQLEDTNQMLFSESISQVVKSLCKRLETFKEETELILGDHQYRLLTATKPKTLTTPEKIEDPVAFLFNIKISNKLDSQFRIEINTKALQFLIDGWFNIIETITLKDFEQQVKNEYCPVLEPQSDEPVKPKEDESGEGYQVNKKRNFGIIQDISLDLIVELGRSEMLFKEVLRLTKGSAIELDRQCNDPVDLYVHDQLVARGEVVAIDDCFGLKITEVLGSLDPRALLR